MRYAIVSDVHANATALRRVLVLCVARGVKKMVCLGDVVGYGGEPNECCDLLANAGIPTIVGNHDRAACGQFEPVYFPAVARRRMLWTRSILTRRSREFLLSLPETLVVSDFVMAHGSLRHNSEYLVTDEVVARSFALQRERFPGAPVCFFGHTHRQGIYEWRAGQVHWQDAAATRLSPGSLYHVNPGSIGYPRYTGVPLSFAIYDDAAGTLEFVALSPEKHPDLYNGAEPQVRWNTALAGEWAKFIGRSAKNFVRNRWHGATTAAENG